MTLQLLIEAIMQQTVALIAKLATTGGTRAPLSHIAGQVFSELASELERQGVSRKVSADMFGLTLRAYQRKTQRLRESHTERGHSLWEAVLTYLRGVGVVSRHSVLERFIGDDQDLVRSILSDLVDSGLVFSTGTRSDDMYRAASKAEIGEMLRIEDHGALDQLVWSMVFNHGPLDREQLSHLIRISPERLDGSLGRLQQAGSINLATDAGATHYFADQFLIDRHMPTGWEAAIYDHFRAVVRTISHRLEPDEVRFPYQDSIGGSTYTFDVGQGHPFESEVLSLLSTMREQCSQLRARVAEHNRTCGKSRTGVNVVAYIGQSVLSREDLAPTQNPIQPESKHQ